MCVGIHACIDAGIGAGIGSGIRVGIGIGIHAVVSSGIHAGMVVLLVYHAVGLYLPISTLVLVLASALALALALASPQTPLASGAGIGTFIRLPGILRAGIGLRTHTAWMECYFVLVLWMDYG